MRVSNSTLLVVILVGILFYIAGPIFVIWALNALFPALAIPTTIETWAAVLILKSFLSLTVSVNK